MVERSVDPFGVKDVLERIRGIAGRSPERDRWLDSLDLQGLSVKALRGLEEGVTGLFGFGAVPVAEIRDLGVADGGRRIPVRLYRGRGTAEGAPIIVYFHGGGFLSGSIDSHDGLTRALANAARAVVLSVGYRLAPEHPYPAALEDGLAVAVRARKRAAAYGCSPDRMVLAGDSAGGTIATVLARLLGEEGRAPAGQLLFYPATDLSRERLFKERPGSLGAIERRAIELFREMVLGTEGALDDPNLSPLLAEGLSVLPPTHIAVGGRDPLRGEAEDYARALRAAGVELSFRTYASQPHGFLGFGRIMKDAGPALEEAGRWVHGLKPEKSP